MSDLTAGHEHTCKMDPEDGHAVCECQCGATAFNSMAEVEWEEPAQSPRVSGAGSEQGAE